MKLYLSSYYFGNEINKLVALIDASKKVAVIMNAADNYGSEKRSIYLKKEVDKFAELGLVAEELDLRNYFQRQKELEIKLREYGAVWVMGGNSFVLRRALRYSGADTILKNVVASGLMTYAGYSAGSVVATPTLRGIELVDDPNTVPVGYHSEVIWEGLNFVNFSIAPHYRSNHPESPAIEHVVSYFKSHNIPYRTLADGEAVVVTESKINLKNTLYKNPPRNGKYYVVAIDGRGGAGKTTLSEYVANLLPGFTIIHGDDYFEPDDNTIAFGSFNDERFYDDVVTNIKAGHNQLTYRPYDWHNEPHITEKNIKISEGVVIERSYSFSFELNYDLKIWVETPAKIALQRGQERDEMPLEEGYRSWKEVWQPKENAHFEKYKPLETADIVLDGVTSFKDQLV